VLDLEQEFDQGLNHSSSPRAATQSGQTLADPEDYAQESPRNGAYSTKDDDILGSPLDEAADVRDEAESAYQRVANEILESTSQVCQKLIADGETALERARFLEAEAEQSRLEAQKELENAKALRVEAEASKEKSLAAVAEAHQRAQEILEWARAEADKHLAKVRQAAAAEAEKLLADAHAVRAASEETLTLRTAAQQELEAQKLYTEAARLRLKAESRDTLAQLREQIGGLLSSTGDYSSPARTAPNRAKKPQGKSTAEPGQGPSPAGAASVGTSQPRPSEDDSPVSRKRVSRGPSLAG
jgi:F0F1-type ATP synthase membrane subunit b/b'